MTEEELDTAMWRGRICVYNRTFRHHSFDSSEWTDDTIFLEGMPMKEFNEEELRAVLGRNPDIDVDAVIADLGRKEGQPVWPGQHVRNTVSERNSSLFPHVVSAQSFDGQLCTSNTGKGWKNPLERSKHIDGTEISAVVDLIPRNSVVDPPPRIPGASNNCVLAYGTASAQWAKADASSVREYPKLYTWWIPMPPEPYVPHGSFDEKKAE